jgi:hypothetical protein
MKTLTNYLTMAVIALLCACGSARADIANGTYTSSTPGSLLPIWDISGEYTGVLDGITVDFTVNLNSSGQFQGQGTFSDSGILGSISGSNSVIGQISGSSTDISITLDMLIGGSGTFLGDPVNFFATARAKLTIDTTNGQLTCTSGTVSQTMTNLTSGSKEKSTEFVSKGDTFPLPSNVTGGWGLTLNLSANGNKYTGTATIQSSVGGSTDFTATGSYSSKTDTSKIKLKGAGGELSLVISTSGSSMTIKSMKGKIYGQKVNFKAQ